MRLTFHSHTSPTRPAALTLTIALMFAGVALCGSPPAAIAQTPGFAGTWAEDLANCKTPQERSNAPLILTAKGLDQHETHCKFTSVKAGGDGEWKVFGTCTVEGDKQDTQMGLTVSGDTLTIQDDAGSRDLLRCP